MRGKLRRFGMGFALIESIHVDDTNGQITIAVSMRVAPVGSNTLVLVLVPSTPDNAETPTARTVLTKGSVQSGSITWQCFAATKTASSLPAPGAGPSPRKHPR